MSDQGLDRCLTVGLDVFLDPQPGVPNSTRYPGRIRGWETGRYLIISFNPNNGMPTIRRGKECVVRFMHEGEVWGFSARFGEAPAAGDLPLLQLSWPKEVARLQVRKHERVAIEIACTIHTADGQDVAATISDISGGGCSIVASHSMNVGDSIHLSFRMPEGVPVDRRPVLVRNRREEGPGRLRYGCQFQEEKEEDRGIELFVARKRATERGEAAPHPQVLVLSRNVEDIQVMQHGLAETPYEVVGARGILDLGHRLYTCNAVGIAISFEQSELSAFEIIPLIRQSEGMEELPLFLYGGSADLRDQAMTMGATHCLEHLTSIQEILSHLPEIASPEPEPEPETPAENDSPEETPASEEPAAATEPDADDEDLAISGEDESYDEDDEDDDDGDEEIELG